MRASSPVDWKAAPWRVSLRYAPPLRHPAAFLSVCALTIALATVGVSLARRSRGRFTHLEETPPSA